MNKFLKKNCVKLWIAGALIISLFVIFNKSVISGFATDSCDKPINTALASFITKITGEVNKLYTYQPTGVLKNGIVTALNQIKVRVDTSSGITTVTPSSCMTKFNNKINSYKVNPSITTILTLLNGSLPLSPANLEKYKNAVGTIATTFGVEKNRRFTF